MIDLLVYSLRKIKITVEKVSLYLLPIPVAMLFFGIYGIINENSPDQLGNIGAILQSIDHSLGLHFLIIAGALGVTYIFWIFTRDIW